MNGSSRQRLALLCMLGLTLWGCERAIEPQPKQPTPQMPADHPEVGGAVPGSDMPAFAGESHDGGQPASDASTLAVAGLVFDVPDGWRAEAPSSAMRAAQFALPGAGGQDGELTVFVFGAGMGGSTQANIDRWLGQLTDPGTSAPPAGERETIETNGLTVSTVLATGTFDPGGMGPMTASEPQPNTTLYGAIVEGGDGRVFLKATGSREVMAAQQDAISAFYRSVRKAL